MMNNIVTTWHYLGQSIYVGNRKKANMRALTFVSIATALLSLALIILNIIDYNESMLIMSVLTFFASFGCAFCVVILKKREYAVLIPSAFCAIVFTVYAVTGAGEGTGILWSLLLPIGIEYFVNVKTGLIMSGYYSILYAVIFYTPFRINLATFYSEAFMEKFPLLFMSISVFTGMAMIQYHKNALLEIDYTNRLSKEVKKQIALVKEKDRQIEQESIDVVTGITNRSTGESEIEAAMKREAGCLVFFDVDNLKTINDTQGHDLGDRLLKLVGDALLEHSKNSLSCRLGGDEFLIFIKNVSKDDAERKVNRIIDDFEKRKSEIPGLGVASLSAGLVMTDIGDEYHEAYGKADKALYHIKQNGKSGFGFYKKEADSSAKKADINRIVSSIKNSGSYQGAMDVEYREFTKLHEFITNLKRRFSHPFKLIMITLESRERIGDRTDELENAMEYMEKAILMTIRDVDVLTRYNKQQFLVILLGSDESGVKSAVDRIFKRYYKMNGSGSFFPSYSIEGTQE